MRARNIWRGWEHELHLTTRQRILRNSADFAPRSPNHDRPKSFGSAQGTCRRLRAASRESSHADAAKALARSAARVARDGQAYEPEVPIKLREWIGPALASKVR